MKSFLLSIKIQIERFIDQTYRRIVGLPTLKRSVITPQLYLGGQYTLRGVQALKKLGITAIVNMRTSAYHQAEIEKDLKYLQLPTPDHHAPKLEDLSKGAIFIDKEIKDGGKVYIHCKAGEGRGPSMAIAYLMYTGLNYDDAVSQIKKVRTFIKPTTPQVKRLKEFEEMVKNNGDL